VILCEVHLFGELHIPRAIKKKPRSSSRHVDVLLPCSCMIPVSMARS
jgi:hypothetical protein